MQLFGFLGHPCSIRFLANGFATEDHEPDCVRLSSGMTAVSAPCTSSALKTAFMFVDVKAVFGELETKLKNKKLIKETPKASPKPVHKATCNTY